MNKKSIIITIFAIYSICVNNLANATLISTIHSDTSDNLNITWYWDEAVPSQNAPVLSNWGANVSLSLYPATPPNSFIGSVLITEVSPIEPHTFIMPIVLIPPFDASQYGTLVDLTFSTEKSIYNFLFVREINSIDSIIKLTASPVPIPGPMILFSSGIFSLLIARKQKIL